MKARQLLCVPCAQEMNHHEDEAIGLKMRKVHIKAKRPENFHMDIIPVPRTLVCNLCNGEIKEREPAVAVTIWMQEDEPVHWEKEYSQ